MAQQLQTKPCEIGQAIRMLRITKEALQRGDIRSGFLLIEFGGSGHPCSASASIDYNPSWEGRRNSNGPDFEFGEWRETE